MSRSVGFLACVAAACALCVSAAPQLKPLGTFHQEHAGVETPCTPLPLPSPADGVLFGPPTVCVCMCLLHVLRCACCGLCVASAAFVEIAEVDNSPALLVSAFTGNPFGKVWRCCHTSLLLSALGVSHVPPVSTPSHMHPHSKPSLSSRTSATTSRTFLRRRRRC